MLWYLWKISFFMGWKARSHSIENSTSCRKFDFLLANVRVCSIYSGNEIHKIMAGLDDKLLVLGTNEY